MIKYLGILGLGSRSTLFYIKEIYSRKYDECSNPPFKLLKTDFNKINSLLPFPSKELESFVKDNIDKLLQFGVDAVLIPNITLHETIDRLNIEAKIIHPIHSTLKEIKNRKYNKVVLFGSNYTMESNYIKSIFEENNIEVLLPSINDMLLTDTVRKQVYHETETEDFLDNFNLTVKKYAQNNAVLIACTELSIILTNDNLRIFDMARIQINQVVNKIENT